MGRSRCDGWALSRAIGLLLALLLAGALWPEARVGETAGISVADAAEGYSAALPASWRDDHGGAGRVLGQAVSGGRAGRGIGPRGRVVPAVIFWRSRVEAQPPVSRLARQVRS
jgi:hypothetical protein